MQALATPFIKKLKTVLVVTFITKFITVILLMVYGFRYHNFMAAVQKRQPSSTRNAAGLLYSEYFQDRVPKINVSVLVVVLSEVKKHERRDMIRRTWWQECRKRENIACVFLLDSLEGQEKNNRIWRELKENNDIVVSPVKRGLLFGHRILFAMQWAMHFYKFNYFVRSDDDIFLCIGHLLHRLSSLPNSYFISGPLHCADEGMVYIDEGISTFSQDVVRTFLSQKPDKMYCHIYGDQTFSTWVEHLKMNQSKLYHVDTRIHHHPPASKVERLKNLTAICHNYVALHGVYGQDMLLFWSRRYTNVYPKTTGVIEVKYLCPFKPSYDWKKFTGIYGFRPALCNDIQIWNNLATRHLLSREH